MDLISALQAGYKTTFLKKLTNDLLEKVTPKVQESAVEKIARRTVTPMQDGLSNVHNDLVSVNSIFCYGKSVFLSAIDSRGNKKTSDYCTNSACEAEIAAEVTNRCIVKSFILDNEQKMLTMRLNFETENIVSVTFGCTSYYLNILCKNVTTDFAMANVVKIQNFLEITLRVY